MGDKEFGSGSNMNISVDDYEIDDMFYVDYADHTEKSTGEGGRRRKGPGPGPGPGPGSESVVPAHVNFSDGEVKDLVDCVDRYGRRWADIKRDYRFIDSPRSSHSLMMKWDQLAKAAKTGGSGDNLMARIREIDARRP